jgi:hypothetical protein
MTVLKECDAGEAPPELVDVEVSDLVGQQTLTLEGVRADTPAGDILGMSVAEMALPSMDYVLRDERTARILRRDQRLSEVARGPRVALRVQPDARMG